MLTNRDLQNQPGTLTHGATRSAFLHNITTHYAVAFGTYQRDPATALPCAASVLGTMKSESGHPRTREGEQPKEICSELGDAALDDWGGESKLFTTTRPHEEGARTDEARTTTPRAPSEAALTG